MLMATIQLKLKSSGKLDDVLQLLDQLDQDLTSQQSADDYAYNAQNADWQNSLDDIASQVNDLTLQINSDDERILELTSELTTLNDQLAGFQAQQTAFSNKRDSLVDARQNDIQAYNKRVSDQTAMLDALEEIIDMLEASTTPGNFAQLKDLVKSNLRKFKETAGPYATLVGLTLSFDPEVVKNILEKLQTIQEALQASIAEDDDEETKAKLDYLVFLQSIDDTLAAIADNLKQCQGDIVDDSFELKNKQDAVAIAQDLVDALTEQQNNIEKARDVYNASYENDKQERLIFLLIN
jgi:chromosome segregation ATPase